MWRPDVVLLAVLALMTPTLRLIHAGENEPIKPSYIGCYRDVDWNRDLEDRVWRWRGSNTVEKCLKHCAILGKKYAGLQNGYACMCGNNYGKHNDGVALPESECDVPCPGDHDTMCGGQLANSIYTSEDEQGEVDLLEILTEMKEKLEQSHMETGIVNFGEMSYSYHEVSSVPHFTLPEMGAEIFYFRTEEVKFSSEYDSVPQVVVALQDARWRGWAEHLRLDVISVSRTGFTLRCAWSHEYYLSNIRHVRVRWISLPQ